MQRKKISSKAAVKNHTSKPTLVSSDSIFYSIVQTSFDSRKSRGRKRLRKKRRKCTQCFEIGFLIVVLVGIAGVIFLISFGFVYMVQRISDPHGFVRKQRYIPPELVHYDLYEDTFLKFTKVDETWNETQKPSNNEDNAQHHPPNEMIRDDIDLSSYGDKVINSETGQCEITVVFMDPRIPNNQPGSPVFYSLETVAMFIPNACVLIQTSKCIIEQSSGNENTSYPTRSTKDKPEKEIYQSIHKSSFPLFRSMIENGQVRVSFLSHQKYELKRCNDFYNPSKALMNYNYWNDEFIDADGDFLLLMQDDSILCHSFDIKQYKQFAFVGATWPKISSIHHTDFCGSMPISWKTWTLPQRKWEKMRSENSKMYPKPDTVLDSLKFPQICPRDENNLKMKGTGIAPVGNGGFSLRNRKYMMKAIQTCPHKKYSGLKLKGKRLACQVSDSINEDLYFGIILRGLSAPLPSGFEAALFSVEMLWPEQTVETYGGPKSFREQRSIASRFWGTRSLALSSSAVYQGVFHQEKYFSVPVGLHKPWKYQSMDLLLSNDMLNQCPLLIFIIPQNYENSTAFPEA